jgi:5'-3' exonuclease
LCLDFNCAMYYVLRQQPPFSVETQAAWERDFCDSIAAYMSSLITIGNPTKGAYVSCDGVVCAAKRRQQRLRRFKGPWVSSQEARILRKPVVETWDQNALTPGSAFMSRLGARLQEEGARISKSRGLEVIVSTTAEAGEGEHKLMRHMRLVRPTSCTIYGLDADLILLAMLLGVDTGASVHLMREAQEFERDTSGADEWRALDIKGLAAAMIPGVSPGRVRDFVACMTLLGNDFLPRSLTRTVRDDGIPLLLSTLATTVWSLNRSIVSADGQIRREGLLAILGAWAASENADMRSACIEAAKIARRPTGIADTPEETELRAWNAQPAQWASLTRLLTSSQKELRLGWNYIYGSWHPGTPKDYLEGVAWTWDYYSGRAVDQAWFFESHLPPLWSSLQSYLTGGPGDTLQAPRIEVPEPLPEWLHLLAVLPADSVLRLLPADKRRLMYDMPWYWPASWSLFDIGRTQLWECEPVLPMIPEPILRTYIKMTGPTKSAT